jgi:hypothetical protein
MHVFDNVDGYWWFWWTWLATVNGLGVLERKSMMSPFLKIIVLGTLLDIIAIGRLLFRTRIVLWWWSPGRVCWVASVRTLHIAPWSDIWRKGKLLVALLIRITLLRWLFFD